MARYIDADALIVELKELREFWGFTFTADGVDKAIDKVEEAPDADVVPKSEVEELKAVIADHKASEEQWEELYNNAKTEVAREIFEEIESVLSFSVYPQIRADGTIKTIKSKDLTVRFEDYETIKKKYTEGE